MTLADFDTEDTPLFGEVIASYFSKVVAVFGGLWFLLMMDWSLTGAEFWRALSLCLGSSVIGGVLFAGLMYATTVPSLRRQMRDRLRRICLSDAALVPPAPTDATHRLICGLILGRSRAAGAVLYIRQRGLTLQLNYPPAPWWKRGAQLTPVPLDIGPPEAITLDQGGWLQAWWHRLLARHQPVVLLIHWPQGAVVLRVPVVAQTCGRLQACIDDLRRRPASPQAAV